MNNDRIIDLTLLGIILIAVILKLTGVITLSWVILFSPLLALCALGGLIIVSFFILIFIKEIINKGD